MDATPSPRHRRIVEPLPETGVGHEQVQNLLFRLPFHAIICDGPADAATLAELVGDQPSAVRPAWLTMLDRILTVPQPVADRDR